jgi:hypothetical protein
LALLGSVFVLPYTIFMRHSCQQVQACILLLPVAV